MNRGIIDIDKQYELEYRYYERDANYKYFNRKFEIYLIEKKSLGKNYVLHMDNCDTSPGKWAPHVHRASDVRKKLYFGVTTLNWHDIKDSFRDCIIGEIGREHKSGIKKAIGKLASPKI